MDLKRRVTELERHLGESAVTLTLADGSTRQIRSSRLLAMISEAGAGGELPADTRAVVDSISDDCQETGNGRLVEVIKCGWAGAVQLAAVDAGEETKERYLQ